MIHPNLATMLAVVTTDYPLEPGEAFAFLRPAVDATLQRDLRRRRVLDERHGAAARERRERCRAHARLRRGVRRRLAHGLRRAREADRRRRRRRHRARRDRGERRRRRRRRRARSHERVATSPLVKTALYGHDANWGRIADGRRLGAVQRRLRRPRSGQADDRDRRRAGARRRPPVRRRARAHERALHDRDRARRSATALRTT